MNNSKISIRPVRILNEQPQYMAASAPMLPIPPDASFLELFSSFGEDPFPPALVPYKLGEWNNGGSAYTDGFNIAILNNIDRELAAGKPVVYRVRHRMGASSIMLLTQAVEGGYKFLNDSGRFRDGTLLRADMSAAGPSLKFFVYRCPYDKDALMEHLLRAPSANGSGGGEIYEMGLRSFLEESAAVNSGIKSGSGGAASGGAGAGSGSASTVGGKRKNRRGTKKVRRTRSRSSRRN